MKLVPDGSNLARRLPVRIVRRGEKYSVVDGSGRTIGTIPSPGRVPRLGRNEKTVFLWREV